MKIFVCGSETVKKIIVERCLTLIHGPSSTQPATELVAINYPGVDKFARDWATSLSIPVTLEENPMPGQYGDMAPQLAYGRAIARQLPDEIMVFVTNDFLQMLEQTIVPRSNFFSLPIRTLHVTDDWRK